MARRTDDEVMALLRSADPLNKARRVFSSWLAKIEQAQTPIEMRRLEFEAVEEIVGRAQMADIPPPEPHKVAALLSAYETGLAKMLDSGYEEWLKPIADHKIVIAALRHYIDNPPLVLKNENEPPNPGS
jgi:hypothetical protein